MKRLKDEQSWKWVMTVIFFIAALVISSNFSMSKYGYAIFGLGHLLGMFIFCRYKDHAMFWNNALFLLVDVWGIFRWIL